MAQALQSLVRHIRTMAGLPRTQEVSDRQLLERFVQGEEAAFAALVQRHGPMVLGVCRRVLQNGHDAEDAFQATFLVLARKAAGGGWHESIGNWLHGVAYRIAIKARAGEIRRRLREQRAAADQAKETADINWSDLRRVLDEELERLPARYRAPLLLCYLEGKTRDEAAHELGWSAGSVKGRLERGRELLRERLSRRGLALSAVLCASLLPESAASAAIPATLAGATVQAGMQFVAGQAAGIVSAQVLSLTQGVFHAMLWTKIKITTALVLTIGALGIGGAITHRSFASPGGSSGNLSLSGTSSFQDPSNEPALAFQDEKRERGREKPDPEARPIQGEIREVDVAKGTITLLLAGGRQATKTFNLAHKDVKVASNFGEKAKLADLKEGMWVSLALSAEMDVTAIRIEAPMASGILNLVKRQNGKTIINVGTGRGIGLFLHLEPDARFSLDGKPCKFTDIRIGSRVVVNMTLDRKGVVALRAGKEPGRSDDGRRDGDGRDSRRTDVNGVIVGIHKNSIDVLVGTDDRGAGVRPDDLKIETYELAKDFVIQAQGREARPGTISDLAKAIRVGLNLSDDKKTVTRIHVVYPVLGSPILAVDAGKRTITTRYRRGVDITLPLAKNVTIMIDGKAATMADLKECERATITLSLDRSHVMGIVVGRRGADGR